jgi:hypothetical protein
MPGNRAHKGLQPPSDPKKRKGLKEAQSAAQEHSAAHPNPLEPAGQTPPHSRTPRRDPRQHPASPPRSRIASLPSSKRIDSASLKATPRRKRQMATRSPARRTEALNAHDSAAAPGSDGVRLPLRTVAVTGVLSVNSCHCTAIPGAVAPQWEPAIHSANVRGAPPSTMLPTPCTSLKHSSLQASRAVWARPSGAARALTRSRPRPSTGATMKPAGAARTPARSPQG